MKSTLPVLIILIVLAAMAWIFWPQFAAMFGFAPDQEEGVVCTADAMQCPDGSWVGRTGPKCEFVCPGA